MSHSSRLRYETATLQARSLWCFVTGNIGYGKPATQSGTLHSLTADHALDGRGFGTVGQGLHHCTHTNAPPAVAYWTVDLDKRHQILNVTIYNRHRGKCNLNVRIRA